MRLTPPSSPRMAKSTSLGVLEHDHNMHIVDQDDIIGLTQDVKNFSDGLARLKCVFNEDCEGDEDLRVLAHERLGDVLCTLKSVLQRYPPLNTTELFSAAGTLIGNIKNYSYEDHASVGVEGAFSDAIDQLALEFSSSVSDYLMGDTHQQPVEDGKTKSYDNLLSVSHETTDKDDTEEEKEEPVVLLTPDQIDATLMGLQAGLELAFQRAKAWSKYLKDVMSYIERRAQLEVEYSKNLSRLAASVKPQLTEEDVEYAKTCQATFTLLQTTKFVEPLTGRRNEHDKVRKTLKENWNKEVKKMQECVSNLRKAQTMYVTRQQEYDKAKELSVKTEAELLGQSSSANIGAKIDKRKKAEDDASHKAAEAETTYKACVAEANNRQTELQKVKAELLAAIRDQIYLSDQAIKKVTIDYFQLLQTVSAPVPVQYHTLCETSKRYEAGSQYGEFVRRLPMSTTADYEEFKFEPYPSSTKGDVTARKVSTQSNESVSSDHHSGEGSPSLSSPRRDKYRVPVKAWGQQGFVANSDTDSQSGSSKSLDSSPSTSPHPSAHKKMVLTGSMDDLAEDGGLGSAGVKQLLAIPGTEQLDVQSVLRRAGQRRNTTFGVDFQEQVEHYHSAVPPIISKCLKEVEKRGITLKGIYRVSGVKSTVETLCQKFEHDPQSVNLDNENPNVISNVLKLYLRQLPEPLLTFSLYQGFVQVAKENMSGGTDKDATIERLHGLIDRLPFSNRKTCGVLMHHLQRIASFCDQNQMNASNLGIVFGPTLLRPQGGNASLACLVDTPHQTRVVELLIVWAQTLFGPNEDHQVIPGETEVEPLDRAPSNSLQVPQPTSIDVPKETKKPEPKKETAPSQTISLTQPKELMPLNVPQSASTAGKDAILAKKSDEDILLPGSTSFSKKETLPKSSPSLSTPAVSYEGRDGAVTNGMSKHAISSAVSSTVRATVNTAVSLAVGSAASPDAAEPENSTDSDIQSDDDLLLPDDSSSAPNSITRAPGGTALIRNRISPPLSPRRSPRLKSPASSPNLSMSSRSSFPSAPSIKIDDSVVPPPDDVRQEPTASHHAYQLPPVNSWYPKGESMFNGILDSRSPQIYRRTNTSQNKTVSYPHSSQCGGTQQSVRVSWPQSSQLSPSSSQRSSAVYESDSEPKPVFKSPKLLRKCTSFDMERSKPFPAGSSITSPMLPRKSTSLEESDKVTFSVPFRESPKESRKVDSGKDLSVHKEEEAEDQENSEVLETPQCNSEAISTVLSESSIDSVAGDNAVKYLVMSTAAEFDAAKVNESLEDASIRETNILDDDAIDSVDNKEVLGSADGSAHEMPHQPLLGYEEVSIQDSAMFDVDALAQKRQVVTDENGRPHLPKTVANPNGQKQNDRKDTVSSKGTSKSHSGPIMGKAGLKPSKKGKESSKATTSSVRSALMTSAAKLKAIGKKNTVTLLSYKSRSICIPDDTEKARPSSTSSLASGSNRKKAMIHQTESSPTVLVQSDRDIVRDKSDKIKELAEASGSVDTLSSSKPKRKESTPMSAPTKGKLVSSRVKSAHPSSSRSSSSENVHKKDKASVAMKSVRDKSAKSSLADSYASEKQERRSSTASKGSSSSSRSGSGSVSTHSGGIKSKDIKTRFRDEKSKSKEDVSKVKAVKRDSISSQQSDSSHKSDSFHDCCHGKRRSTDKKVESQSRKTQSRK